MRPGSHQTEEARRLIAEGVREVWARRNQRGALIVAALEEALDALDAVGAWLQGEGDEADEDRVVQRAEEAAELARRLLEEAKENA